MNIEHWTVQKQKNSNRTGAMFKSGANYMISKPTLRLSKSIVDGKNHFYQENFNLYRDHDYLDLKVQMRKLLHAGWFDHN